MTTRIATIPLQMLQSRAIANAQQKLATAQTQLATGRKSETYAGLGSDAAISLSGRTVMATQDAYATVSQRLQTQLALVNSNLEGMYESGTELQNALIRAVGTGRAPGLQETIQLTFGQFRASINASGEKGFLFAGGGKDAPFAAGSLSDLQGVAVETLFRDGAVEATARVADGVDLKYGIRASDVATDIARAFKVLAEAGPIDAEPTPAQLSALTEAVSLFKTGLRAMGEGSAANGRRQAQLEQFEAQAVDRRIVLQELVGKSEDADLGLVAVAITQQQTVLEASYGVIARLSRLSLLNFLN